MQPAIPVLGGSRPEFEARRVVIGRPASVDVFLSHARQDFETLARPIEEACRKRSVSVWLDQAQIRAGESLPDLIGRGIASSRFVLVLITEAFLARRWTLKEFRDALAVEADTGVSSVIPVLVVDRALAFDRVPVLEDRFCPSLADLGGADGVAKMIAERLQRRSTRWWTHAFEAQYVGPVWTRVQSPARARPCEITFLWGPLRRTLKRPFLDGMPLSFTHHKLGRDVVAIHVILSRPGIVTFGQGPPVDPSTHVEVNDEGWERIAGAPLLRARGVDDLGEDPGDWQGE